VNGRGQFFKAPERCVTKLHDQHESLDAQESTAAVVSYSNNLSAKRRPSFAS
jgi:hypothetical protein